MKKHYFKIEPMGKILEIEKPDFTPLTCSTVASANALRFTITAPVIMEILDISNLLNHPFFILLEDDMKTAAHYEQAAERKATLSRAIDYTAQAIAALENYHRLGGNFYAVTVSENMMQDLQELKKWQD